MSGAKDFLEDVGGGVVDIVEDVAGFAGDVVEGVVTTDCQGSSAALVEGDARVGDAAAYKGLGRCRCKANGASACDGET